MSEFCLRADSTDRIRIYQLPDGWEKRFVKRMSGALIDKSDCYLSAPSQFHSKRLRSTVDLMKFIIKYPKCPMDFRFVNMEYIDENQMTVSPSSSKHVKLLETFLAKVKAGEDVEEFFQKKKSTPSNGTDSSMIKKKCDKSSFLKLKKELGFVSLLTVDQTLALERVLVNSPDMPSTEQVLELSQKLNLSQANVENWFKAKWKGRILYRENMLRHRTNLSESDDSSEPRLPFSNLGFDLNSNFDDTVSFIKDDVIVRIENAELDEDPDEDISMHETCFEIDIENMSWPNESED